MSRRGIPADERPDSSSTQTDRPKVANNTIVLIIVVAVAALVITGLVAIVVRKTRNQNCHGLRETIRRQVRENSLRLRREEVFADESDASPPGPASTLKTPAPSRHKPAAVSRPRSPD